MVTAIEVSFDGVFLVCHVLFVGTDAHVAGKLAAMRCAVI
jgi:hypothetical protein